MRNQNKSAENILWFEQIDINDVSLVGGKNASLGEMYQELTKHGVRVPNGFAITTKAYREFLHKNKLEQRLQEVLRGIDVLDMAILKAKGEEIRQMILEAELPQSLQQEVVKNYQQLLHGHSDLASVAVRSSAIAEDMPGASFAGQMETYLNIRGESELLRACKKCFASLFTDRAISYRTHQRLRPSNVQISIGVQEMVRSDLASAGVMFTLDTESGFTNVILINAAYGLGENIVKGSVNPDEYFVFKPTLNQNFRPIIQKKLGSKEWQMVYANDGEEVVKNIRVSHTQRMRFALNDDDILELARAGRIIEKHYSDKAGRAVPMDIEWAKDGESGKLFIVQARPETVHSQKEQTETQFLQHYRMQEAGKIILRGKSVGDKMAKGVVHVINSVRDLEQLRPGEILVTDKTDPDWEPAMKKAGAIVTNRGGRTCHAAIVARELGIPAVVGTESGTQVLKSGDNVTINCSGGEEGVIYQGLIDFEIDRTDLSQIARPATQIMMNIGDPDQALRLSFLPNDGVGLARTEFIISNWIKVHPMALLEYEKMADMEVKQQIRAMAQAYDSMTSYFVDKLGEGVGMIAAAFYPKEVIVRLSDFKSNEYRNLLGGKEFEPQEENPMLGFRGASRYYDPKYGRAFALELQAMKKVRDRMGLVNIKLMIPFCRTLEEARLVIETMEQSGLKRGENGLEIYMMCEIPSNVVLLSHFAQFFDGFSIGTNDLTQLVLGVDRDSSDVAHIFDERNPAVKKMLNWAITSARGIKKKIGVCGQAPSDYPEFCEFLVQEGIDSISLSPDAILKVMQNVAQIEKRRLPSADKMASKSSQELSAQ